MNKPRSSCPRCDKCIHRTLERSPIIHKWVVGCDAKRCEYVRKDGEKNDERRVAGTV